MRRALRHHLPVAAGLLTLTILSTAIILLPKTISGVLHDSAFDLVLASDDVAGRVQAAWVDRHARKGKGPSDHAPVIVDLDEAPDGDIGPVVPPPSNPVLKKGVKKIPQASP